MESKRFSKNDAGLVCAHCGKTVEPLGYTSRNHCPFCLWSLHVDIMPGDRQNACRGRMRPIAAEPDPRRGYIITHECEACGARVRNRTTRSPGSAQEDDLDLLIALTAGEYKA